MNDSGPRASRRTGRSTSSSPTLTQARRSRRSWAAACPVPPFDAPGIGRLGVLSDPTRDALLDHRAREPRQPDRERRDRHPQRREPKKSVSSAAHSAASSPPATTGPVVQARLGEDVEHRPGGARLRVGRAVDDARHAREHDRARAHRARLERHVQAPTRARATSRARGWPRAAQAARRAPSDPGAARARCAPRDDLAVVHDDRADRDVARGQAPPRPRAARGA